jgi:hypothetical protein
MTVQLFCGDCLEIMPTIGKVDAAPLSCDTTGTSILNYPSRLPLPLMQILERGECDAQR